MPITASVQRKTGGLKSDCEQQGKPYKYDRHCLGLTAEEINNKLAAGIPFVIRQKMPDTEAPASRMQYTGPSQSTTKNWRTRSS